MNLIDFCGKIELENDAVKLISDYKMSEKEYQEYFNLFHKNHFLFFDKVRSEKDCPQKYLYLFTRFSIDCYKDYQLRNISDIIYFDTFKDISVWEKEHRRKTGEIGLSEDGWLWLHPKLQLFRLGRLQFQPVAMPKTVELPEKTVFKDQIVLNVHIPKDGAMPIEEVHASYKQAKAFFRGITDICICASWLLSPALQKLLPKSSNIIKFQNEYTIYQTENGVRQAEERIFGQVSNDFDSYPEETSLQKAAKEYLKKGGEIVSSEGIKLL